MFQTTRKIILSILIIHCFISVSQTDDANHQKYWFYKTRLNNDFVKVGLEAGESVPFNQRGAFVTDFYPENALLIAGDATSTIGYYIGLLATEYYLLSENGQDVSKTKHELFCALNAVNRLDYKAEGLYEAGSETLNGFFIKDDIPPTFTSSPEYYDHFNYYSEGLANNKKSRGFNSWFQTGTNMVTSSWIDHLVRNADIAMSQDQVYCLLFGLTFVSKYVPDWETDNNNKFGYGSDQTSLTNEARNIAGRIINYIRNPTKPNGDGCKSTLGWNIKNPITCEEVQTGNDAQSFAYALGEGECFIRYPGLAKSNGSRRTNVIASCSGKGFHNAWSKTIGFEAWNASAKSILYIPSNSHYSADTRSQIVNMAAVCNCVYGTVADAAIGKVAGSVKNVRTVNWLGQAVNYLWMGASAAISTFIPGAYINLSRQAINQNSYINGNGGTSNPFGDPGSPFDHAPLARKILHGGRYNKNKRYGFKYLLDVAPCDNIYNLNNLNYGHYEWSSDSRLDRPDRRGWYGHNSESGNPFNPQKWRPPSGEYNGIDYMLYHNLWYIYKKQKGSKAPIVDLSDIYLNENSQLNTCIGAFETISVENAKILGDGDEQNWRSGKTIYFGPGTEISGNFHAYIKKFICATDIENPCDDGREMDLADTTGIVKNPDFYAEGLYIVPNPTKDLFKIYFNVERNEKIFIDIYDMQGNLVLTMPEADRTDTGMTIDLGGKSAGLYIIKGYTSLGKIMTKKIIKL